MFLKYKSYILLVFHIFLFTVQPVFAKYSPASTPDDSMSWWEICTLISIPVTFFLFFAVLEAYHSREVRIRFALCSTMITIGCGLLYVSIITDKIEILFMALLTGFIYISIGLWYVYLKDRFSAEARSLRELPLIAEKFGLTYIESQVIGSVGHMEGTFSGYPVKVQPNGETGDGRFAVALKKNLGDCEISFDRTLYRPSQGLVEFKSGNTLFDKRFKTRYATEKLAVKLQNAGVRLGPIVHFVRKWRLTHRWAFGIMARSWLKVTNNNIAYSDVPLKGGSYVMPARIVEKVLPDLISMARAFDEIADMKDT